VIIPIVIGCFVSGYLLYQNFQEELFVKVAEETGNYIWKDLNQNQWEEPNEFFISEKGNYQKQTISELLVGVNWGWYTFLWLLLAILTMAIRDFAYMIRLRILSDYELNWRQTFRAIMLWETASAITPSIVGGSGIAMFILNRENISLGRSTAIVMITALLDELFFILIVPITILWLGYDRLFPEYLSFGILGEELDVFTVFLLGYGFIIVLTSFITWGIFFKPFKLKKLLFRIFSLRFLLRWRTNAIVTGNDIIAASKIFRGKPISFWLKSFGATSMSWLARYFTANMVIMAFVFADDHILIVGRQLVMWVIMLISPTPGGSGVAEVLFASLLKDASIEELALVAAIVWRMVSYYPYLFIGSFIFPTWLRNTSKKM
jgi:hypothetical protein